jgi:hypothetical protein
MHQIVMISADKLDVVVKMGEEVDNFMKDFVENDDFLKKIPEEAAESVKRELKPFVEEAYVPQVFCLFLQFLKRRIFF